jgi:gamma-glutamylcyclotransferase (GGCT)/AIG2-like uncharacterized protein YtfP
MKYFAYGSNMSLKRIRQRAPSAIALGTFSLGKHELTFNKHGRDNSGKCDACYTGHISNTVMGVLYQIESSEKAMLDSAEGLGCGYDEKEVTVSGGKGNLEQAFIYYATNINDSQHPFTWYKEHVLVGAREANLPKDYIAGIEAIHAVKDHDPVREALQRSLHG